MDGSDDPELDHVQRYTDAKRARFAALIEQMAASADFTASLDLRRRIRERAKDPSNYTDISTRQFSYIGAPNRGVRTSSGSLE